jgi:cyclopropane-fatty-acyl-phospholipid synthase
MRSIWSNAGHPPIDLLLWDGSQIAPRENQPSVGRIHIRERGLVWRMLWDPALGFGDGYCRGRITVEGVLTEVMTALMSGLANAAARGRSRSSFRDRLIPRRGQSRRQSRSSVAHHYDIGNDFYRLWLDEEQVYTCAYYRDPGMSLEEAQLAKFEHICRKLRLKPGETVIEAGCGWGGLALYMARHHGVRVRAYNLSREQMAYARERARREDLDHQVEFVEADYRTIDGICDVFVSVGMLEHVGPGHYRELAGIMDRVLTADGRGLIHTIGRNVARPLDAWTERYIFPGAEPPSLRQMMDLFEGPGFSVVDVENLRRHYARTCADWLERFTARENDVARMFDQTFVRMWRFYLASSVAAFRSGHLQLFQVLFARPTANVLPLTRDDIYRQGQDAPSVGEPSHRASNGTAAALAGTWQAKEES